MIPLTVRSHYSLMWGTASVERLCRAARQLGYERLALTDTDNLYGLWPFLTACAQEGLTPVVGAEVTEPGSRRRAVCLVENPDGYRNLCRLLTRRHLDDAFDLQAAVIAHGAGMVVLSSDAALIGAWHAAELTVAAAMPRRPLAATHRLRQTVRRLDLPLVATPGSFFLQPQEFERHRLLRAIAGNTVLSRLAPHDVADTDAWLASPAEYERRFAICPQAVRASHMLAERLTFTGPRFGLVMPPWQDTRGRPATGRLRTAAYAGARRRYGGDLPEAVVERLEHELEIIARMDFCAYFLIVRDIVRLSPRTCGRGSGAASLVAYCLGITNVCPVKHNLYFERFLNPGRKDPPDIDVDFAWDERDAVLKTVFERHRSHAAMVSNHVCFQPRMAIREVAKVYGLTDAEIGRVARRLPWFWRQTSTAPSLLEGIRQQPRARALALDPPWSRVMAEAQGLLGLPRYLSVHPGGVVITPAPIDTYVPVERAAKGVPVIQWEKEGTETAGLIKIDLLGNRSLGVIRDAVANVHHNGQPLDEKRWEPEDDISTQEALAQGRTMGCFYIESPAMRLLQQKSGVGDFEHLVIHSSIIRPAANEFIQEYIRRLHGGAWDPIHPRLADVLDETFGIMVYQEDVSRVAVALAGFSPAEADGLRKVLSKKDREIHLRDYCARFVDGARRQGVDDRSINQVWDMMMSFDGYSFCKPHSASYARVSFQAAYLKVHHPAEFMAAVISNQGGFYSTFAYVSESRRMGLTVLPPDVNHSNVPWSGHGRNLRVGLMALHRLGDRTRKRIVDQRRKTPFSGLADFLQRIRPDETEARAMIHAGALDAFNPGGHHAVGTLAGANRVVLMWQLACWQKGRAAQADKPTLFAPSTPESPPALPPQNERERLRNEFAVLGFVCDRHPMTLFARRLRRLQTVKAAVLHNHLGRQVQVAAWLITGKLVRTKHGQPMEFLTFEDDTALVETTFFPKVYERFCHLLDRGRPYLLTGRVEQNWGALTLTVSGVAPLAP